MKIIKLLIERSVFSLDRPFTYLYDGFESIDVGYRVLVPFNKGKPVIGYIIEIQDSNKSKEEIEKETGFSLSYILQIIDDKPLINDELMELANQISSYYISPLISVLQTMLPSSLKPRRSALKGPKIAYDKYLVAIDNDVHKLTAKQFEIYSLIKNSDKVLKREIKSPSIIKKLIEEKYLKEILIEKTRLQLPNVEKEQPKKLNDVQKKAFDSIINTDKTVSLLQGVTGSGKTEVYVALSNYYISQGKSIIMLVPEISLTPVMCSYFLKRFSNNVAILHSELSDGEKYDEYRRIAKGEVKIVVGTRSAIFAPLKNIGLIILDEEHVESYKQENVPCYHAREIAIMRANYNHAKVVLGSATPSLESKARAIKNIYNHVIINKRFNEKELPNTKIIDMSNYANMSRESSIFSVQLIDKLKKVFENKEQAILLINKRGYSNSIFCRSCGKVIRCPDCGIPLTYHKNNNILKCHHCDYAMYKPPVCPSCKSKYLSTNGFGTEKIVDELYKLFPNIKVLRLDSDVGQIKNNIAKTLKSFANLEADVLVGTQMIAKGHDFPNVTLVGVVSADIGLSLPTYRSSERVFQLITQAVGRAGRKDKLGSAIIQTFNPNHYAITCSSKQDYEQFFLQEMQIRKQTQYPPCVNLISLDVSALTERYVEEIANSIKERILKQNIENVTILGPVQPYIAKENGKYHRIIILKTKNNDIIKAFIKDLLNSLKGLSQVNIKVDIDPYSI